MSRADVTRTGLHGGFSDEDRAAYEELLCDAGYDEWGQQYPAHEIKARVHERLTAAAEAGAEWAVHVLDRDAQAGHLHAFRRWDRTQHVVSTRHGERVVKRAAVVSMRRRDPRGDLYYQGSFLEALSLDEVLEQQANTLTCARGVQDRYATLERLRVLMVETGVHLVGPALDAVGMTLDEYLMMTPPEVAS
ncbi:hypothetical protein AB0O22_12850 [Streptomyces sp. NPDC091204]|uniref:hypothetical protein n=1 Tax=Streptomyces sp. NPDC091204 TaxID=3155299 RepID=UPI00341CB5D4